MYTFSSSNQSLPNHAFQLPQILFHLHFSLVTRHYLNEWSFRRLGATGGSGWFSSVTASSRNRFLLSPSPTRTTNTAKTTTPGGQPLQLRDVSLGFVDLFNNRLRPSSYPNQLFALVLKALTGVDGKLFCLHCFLDNPLGGCEGIAGHQVNTLIKFGHCTIIIVSMSQQSSPSPAPYL